METPQMKDIDGTWKEILAAHLVRSQVRRDYDNLKEGTKLSAEHVSSTKKDKYGLPSANPTEGVYKPNDPELKVGIIGGGIAGMYTAHLLNFLQIPYEILEANPKRVGGRLYTHRFSDNVHDYYDIGAMRYPNSPVMFRTFKLFTEAGLFPLLRRYYMRGPNQPTRYNDITRVLPDIQKSQLNEFEQLDDEEWEKSTGFGPDPFKVSKKNGGPVPNQTVKNPDVILDNAYDYYREKIKRDPASGFKYLINHDKFSLRDYLAFVEDQDPETIEWLETLNSATGWFGQAFTENVMESLAFDFDESTKWWCIDGGTSKLVDAMRDKLGIKVELGKEVTKIAYRPNQPGNLKMEVHVRDYETRDDPSQRVEKHYYATVINTTTMAALQRMDIRGLHLPYASKTAIRSLHYDTSTKVGIRFKNMWWRDVCGITQAGLGKTDLPLRVCVYPSYNWDDYKDPNDHKVPTPGVLLCSYTWGQDSERVASLVDNGPLETNGPFEEYQKTNEQKKLDERLKELMFDNLAKLHSTDDASYDKMYSIIKESYDGHHAYDWSKDPFSSSAFALYGPGDFRKFYSTLARPATDGRFHVVGEASSAHHAWIVGALDSALRGVWLFLERFKLHKQQQAIKKAEMEYRKPGEGSDGKPYPVESVKRFGTTGEIDYETAHLQVALGMLWGKDGLPVDHSS